MRIAIEHNTTREKARKIVEKRLRDAEKQYGQMASDLDWEWHGDTLHVNVKAKGMHLKGDARGDRHDGDRRRQTPSAGETVRIEDPPQRGARGGIDVPHRLGSTTTLRAGSS